MGTPLPFSTANITKLALATDLRSSSLAIYADKRRQPFIWGLIDQANQTYAFSLFESSFGLALPGLFHLSILGTAHISASAGFVRVAELQRGSLIHEALAVLEGGPVRALLQPGIDSAIARVCARVSPDTYNARGHWDASVTWDWLRTLARLLNRIQSYGHGGAILITTNPSSVHLNIKYAASYPRLRVALEDATSSSILTTAASDEIFGFLDRHAEEIPAYLYLDESVEQSEARDSRLALEGALWFVSLLSRVDGLVLMQPDLSVVGFGVEITCPDAPPEVFIARDRDATENRLKPQSYEHFGTRHRSMMRYCYHVPGSLGFVVSQDGHVRAITRLGTRVVIWENLLLRWDAFAKVRRRRARPTGAT